MKSSFDAAVAERDLWKEACRRAGVCMSCAIRTPEPFGCTDCLNTGWNCGEPVECQKARDEAFELAASDVEGCARNGRSLPSEMAACIRARKGSPAPARQTTADDYQYCGDRCETPGVCEKIRRCARQDSDAVALLREALEDIRSILGPKPGFVGQQILAIANKALSTAPAPERRDVLREAISEWVADRTPKDDAEKALFVAAFDAFPDDFGGKEHCPCGEQDDCDECLTTAGIKAYVERMRAALRTTKAPAEGERT